MKTKKRFSALIILAVVAVVAGALFQGTASAAGDVVDAGVDTATSGTGEVTSTTTEAVGTAIETATAPSTTTTSTIEKSADPATAEVTSVTTSTTDTTSQIVSTTQKSTSTTTSASGPAATEVTRTTSGESSGSEREASGGGGTTTSGSSTGTATSSGGSDVSASTTPSGSSTETEQGTEVDVKDTGYRTKIFGQVGDATDSQLDDLVGIGNEIGAQAKVLGSQVTRGSTPEEQAETQPAAQAKETSQADVSPGQLALTGADVAVIFILGLVLAALGGGVTKVGNSAT